MEQLNYWWDLLAANWEVMVTVLVRDQWPRVGCSDW